jgi:GT2 family glycosyltransferase
MHNILIGICTGGTIRAETVAALVAAMDTLRDKGVTVNLSVQVGNFVDYNRNRIVTAALEHGCSHIMFVDSDMVFPSSGIIRLLDHDKDIVGANYNMRGNPSTGDMGMCTTKMADADGNLIAVNAEDIPTQLFKCHALGTGFMLIKSSVFAKLKKPYFQVYEDPDGTSHTEDINFCAHAGEAGFGVWCSPSIKMQHIGAYAY